MRIVAPDLAKFLEDLCLILRRNPDAGVADRNLHRTISLPGINSDPPSLRGELNGVGKKVKKDLFDLALITDKIPKMLINSNIKVDAVLSGSFAHKRPCVVYCQREIERSNL